MADLLLRNCEAINATGEMFCSILISDGRIQAILAPNDRPHADSVIDVRGRPVIPGAIDTHLHLGSSGATSFEEDCASESRSAALMGITTLMNFILEMRSYTDLIPEMDAAIERSSLVDMWHHAAIMTEEQLEEMPSYIRKFGISSFKFFMAYKGPEAMTNLQGIDDGMLLEALTTLADYPHVVPMVHAENMELVLRAKARVQASGRDELSAWSAARPALAEEEAQQRAWFLAREAGSRLLTVHMSAGYTASQLLQAKIGHSGLYGETCPQYLSLDDSMPLGGIGKCNPPVRDRRNAELLWRGLADGSIDFVGSDHCPYPKDVKDVSIWDAAPGLPSMPAILPVLLSDGVNKGRISLRQLVQVTSYNAARIFGLLPRKGKIAVGADADLTVLDLQRRQIFTPEVVGSGLDWSPYEGIEFTGWPQMTVVAGRVVAEDGAIVDDTGRGKRLRAVVGG